MRLKFCCFDTTCSDLNRACLFFSTCWWTRPSRPSRSAPSAEVSSPIEKEWLNTFRYFTENTFSQNCSASPAQKRKDWWKNCILSKIKKKSSCHSSMVSTAACYRGGPGFKSRQGQEFINFWLKRKFNNSNLNTIIVWVCELTGLV